MNNKKLSQEDKEWRARDDAETLARYQEILNDKSRLNLAKKQAEIQANELNTRVNTLKKVSNLNGGNKNGRRKSK